jgi:dCMP deaminase
MKHATLYMDLADRISVESKCLRLNVGAVIVKDKNIIAFGWNGTISGFPNECECDGVTKAEVVHAEANAIFKAARSTESTEGATLFCTHSCCIECAKMIIQSGITEFIYRTQYRDHAGLLLLERAGIKVTQQP